MFKHKKLFIDNVKARKVRKEIAMKKMKESGVEETGSLGNNNNSEWLRSFNALMRTTPPDFNRFLKSSS